MKITIKDFNKPKDPSQFMDTCGNYEIEQHLVWRLNKHIETNTPFNKPIKGKHRHNKLVEKGYLTEKDNGYIFTKKSLGLLFSIFGRIDYE